MIALWPSPSQKDVYDEAGHIVGEYTSAGALIQETVWMGDIPVATLRPKVGGGVDVFYVHTDHLDTPRVITQPSNNAERWRWDSDPFGTNLPNENPAGAGTFVYNLRFPGQQYDGLVGMHYNYFRDYDASTGRYFESDPIGLKGGINTFGYVAQSPIAFTDEFGLARPAPGSIRNVPCSKPESERCRATCESQGKTMQSCMRVEKFKATSVKQPDVGPILTTFQWVKINESCSCHEPNFCRTNPGSCALAALGLVGACLAAPELALIGLGGAVLAQ